MIDSYKMLVGINMTKFWYKVAGDHKVNKKYKKLKEKQKKEKKDKA